MDCTSPWATGSLIRSALVPCLLITVLAACGEAPTVFDPAAPDTTTQDTTGTFQRADLVVTVEVSGEASEAAQALGSPAGRLAGARVLVVRRGSGERDSTIAGSSGTAEFTELLPGPYDITVSRVLNEAEAEQVAALGDAFEGINAFGGGTIIGLEAPGDTVPVEAVASRRGSLVFSELFHARPLAGSTFYRTGQYYEFYNNADSTIYMDGKILASGFWYNWLSPNSDRECPDHEQWRTDSRGIWVTSYVRFPGSGSNFPVGAGETVLVAMDAIDHREFAEGMHDLRGADFEYVGATDVDNPNVPNVADIGPNEWTNVVGEGLYIPGLNSVLLLAEPLDPSSLVQEQLPVSNQPEHHLIPTDRILDVVTLGSKPETVASLDVTYCTPFVNERFDRSPAFLLDDTDLTGIHRPVLATSPAGHPILQRTRTSAADLVRMNASPGAVQ